MAPHGEALDATEAGEAPDEDAEAENGAPGGNDPEAVVCFFDCVFEVHAIEGSDEGAGCYGEGGDREAEVEKHEGVAVGVKDGFYAVGPVSRRWKDGEGF
jgi:hypothetical protein